jgi:hypothetical protein
VNLSCVIISLVPPGEPMDGPVTRGVWTHERTLFFMNASMVAIQFGFAAIFLAAVIVRADEDMFGLDAKANIICLSRTMDRSPWSRHVFVNVWR